MEKKTVKKIAVVGVVVALVAAFWIFDLRQYFTLSYVKESREGFQALYSEHRAEMIAAFMGIYILVTSLSLPGAAVMTLAAGALFGLLAGTVMVSFASTIGATIACFVARFVLRDWVQNRFGQRLGKINEGVEREGAFYLFTLRLIPVFPFWLINLALGVTRLRLRTFYWVSQVGMLPGTIVYVNAGKELGRIESASEIFTFRLIASFALLGIFPITAKKLIQLYRSKKGKKPVTTSGS
ncbi:MAG: TVP38/TMEM64 family protein [Nitrospirota bacterium]|jgi:uncharacterized membrane protein YdjX (TVP38/TMEM64 family)